MPTENRSSVRTHRKRRVRTRRHQRSCGPPAAGVACQWPSPSRPLLWLPGNFLAKRLLIGKNYDSTNSLVKMHLQLTHVCNEETNFDKTLPIRWWTAHGKEPHEPEGPRRSTLHHATINTHKDGARDNQAQDRRRSRKPVLNFLNVSAIWTFWGRQSKTAKAVWALAKCLRTCCHFAQNVANFVNSFGTFCSFLAVLASIFAKRNKHYIIINVLIAKRFEIFKI